MARKKTTTPEIEKQIRDAAADGKTYRELSEMFSVSTTVIGRVLKSKPPPACAREGEARQEADNQSKQTGQEVTKEDIVESYKETGSMRKTASLLGVGKGRVESVMGSPEYVSVKEAMKRARKVGVEIRTKHVEEQIKQSEIAEIDDHAKDMGERRRREMKTARGAIAAWDMIVAVMRMQFERGVDPATLEIRDEEEFKAFMRGFGLKDAVQAQKVYHEIMDPSSIPGVYFEWYNSRLKSIIVEEVKDSDTGARLARRFNLAHAELRRMVLSGRGPEDIQ